MTIQTIESVSLANIRTAIKNQYHAALAMLRFGIENCPDELWTGGGFITPTWRIAYHALYYAHLYLMPRAEDFTPWPKHQTSIQDLDDQPSPPEIMDLIELPHRPPQTGVPYTKAEILEYWHIVDELVDDTVDALDLAADSGFPWYPGLSKLEHQMVNLRHIEHHMAQIGARLRERSGGTNGIDWVGSGRTPKWRVYGPE